MEPAWDVLREFRDRAGFHADAPEKFFGARHRFQKEWPTVEAALVEFQALLEFFLKAEEKELANEFEPALDSLLNDLEKQLGGNKFNREQTKAYLMLPNAQSGGVHYEVIKRND